MFTSLSKICSSQYSAHYFPNPLAYGGNATDPPLPKHVPASDQRLAFTGGILFLVKNSLPSVRLHPELRYFTPSSPNHDGTASDIAWLSFSYGPHQRALIGAAYYHQSISPKTLSSLNDNVSNALRTHMGHGPILILGDFNLRHPKWMPWFRPQDNKNHTVPNAAAFHSFIQSNALSILN